MVQFHQTRWLNAVSHCSRKSRALLPLPFPLSPCLYSAPGCALLPLTLHLWRCLSGLPWANVNCSVRRRSFLNWVSQALPDLVWEMEQITPTSKGKREIEKEAEGMSPPALRSSELSRLSDCKAAKLKYLSIPKAWWDNALLLAL